MMYMYIWLWHVPLRIYYKIKCILCQIAACCLNHLKNVSNAICSNMPPFISGTITQSIYTKHILQASLEDRHHQIWHYNNVKSKCNIASIHISKDHKCDIFSILLCLTLQLYSHYVYSHVCSGIQKYPQPHAR